AHFASRIGGAVSQFNYAKQFFTAPMAVLAQAAGAASMPFFASLWAKNNRFEFANVVADSVSRVACLGLLVASAMIHWASLRSISSLQAAILRAETLLSAFLTSQYFQSPCSYGRRRQSIRGPSMRPGIRWCPWW